MSRKRIFKGKARRWLSMLAVVLASVTLCGMIVTISDGGENFFKPSEWSFRDVNEDNLFQTATFNVIDDDGTIRDNRSGVTVKLTDDNTIKLNGEAEEDITQLIATVQLKANTSYVFDSSLNNGSTGTIYMSINVAGTEYCSFNDPVVINGNDLAMDESCQITLHIKDEYKVGRLELKPVICEGTSANDVIDFYA